MIVRALAILAALVFSAVLLAVAVGGCGGSDTTTKADYAADVVKARDRVDYSLAQITVGQGTVKDLIARMQTAAGQIEEAADDLDDAGVADGFEEQHDALVAALRQLAADLDGTASDASQPGMEGLLTGANALQFPSWLTANRILDDLSQQGIEVDPIGSH